jgi:Domain of unknown function (DUF4336)
MEEPSLLGSSEQITIGASLSSSGRWTWRRPDIGEHSFHALGCTCRVGVEPIYALVVELYAPINTLKPVGEDLWVVDGPIVRMAFLGGSMPFPTRMVVVRLANGDLFLWSPTEPDNGLRDQIDALGPVRHLISPNKLHYAYIGEWQRVYPEATTWASPRVRERAASQRIEVSFEADLGNEPEPAWREDFDQLIFRGSRFMVNVLPQEVVFFHRRTRTLILADLILNFEIEKVGGAYRRLIRFIGAADPDGKAPIDLRLLTLLVGKDDARCAFERMVAWKPQRVIMAHGRWYARDGTEELRRAFRWLGSK